MNIPAPPSQNDQVINSHLRFCKKKLICGFSSYNYFSEKNMDRLTRIPKAKMGVSTVILRAKDSSFF